MVFNVGDRVKIISKMEGDYIPRNKDQVFTVSRIRKSYAPPRRWWPKHPGYDVNDGGILYDLEGLRTAIYGYQLEATEETIGGTT